MGLHNAQGIVLRRFNLSEKDKLVTFLTDRYGKIKVVAKSARMAKSRFGAALEPLSVVQLIYFGRENQVLYRLNQAEIDHSFQSIREDSSKIYSAAYFIELTDSLIPEGYPEPQVFQLLKETLETLENNKPNEILIRLFELRLMGVLGYTPQLTHCLACKKEPPPGWVGFSYNRRGILCQPCTVRLQPGTRFQQGVLIYLKKMLTLDPKNSNRLKLPKGMENEIEAVTHRLILSHLGRELKSYPFIKALSEIP